MIIQSPTSWISKAACKGRTELFYSKLSERPQAEARRVAKAKQICSTCPVIEECREAGRVNREFGVWGGETDEDRYALGFFNNDPVIRKRQRASERRRLRREERMKNARENT